MEEGAEDQHGGSRNEGAREAPFILAPFNPTCDHAQQVGLSLLNLTENDVLFDLGCGDGRVLVSAATAVNLTRCVGIEMDAAFAAKAVVSVKNLPRDVQSRIEIRQGDALGESGSADDIIGSVCHDLDLIHDCTALYLYLLPKGLARMQSLLDEIAKRRRAIGVPFRVVTYMFQIRAWEPTLVDRTTKGSAPVYLYEIVAAH
jgi:SAM-dependent methyltransferase